MDRPGAILIREHHAPGARKARRTAISPGHLTFSPSFCLASAPQIAGPLTVQEVASGPVRSYGQGEDCDQEVPAVTISSKPFWSGWGLTGDMQHRSHKHRHVLIATLPLALLLAACGGGTSPSSPSRSTPTPTATTTLVPATRPNPTDTPPSPTAVPTPLPEPTLAVLEQGQELMVVNTQGVEQWELSNAVMEKIFGASASQEKPQGFGVNSQIAG